MRTQRHTIAANGSTSYTDPVARNPVTIRISDDLNARLEALVVVLQTKMAGAAEVTKASIIRAALDKGLTVLEAEHSPKSKRSK